MTEKCVLEAFGTGVPARNVTVKIKIRNFIGVRLGLPGDVLILQRMPILFARTINVL